MISEVVYPQLESDAEPTLHRRILIIEDDEDQCHWLDGRFRKLGYETLTAVTGSQGLRLAQSGHPQVVVLDALLPDTDGLEVCRRIVDGPETCSIPVIVVSGREGGDMVRSARHAGCRFFLRKPYDPNTLLALVESSLAWPDP